MNEAEKERLINEGKMVDVLCGVLADCTYWEQPCDLAFKTEPGRNWCEKHCKKDQDCPDKECWKKYAEVMAGGKYD